MAKKKPAKRKPKKGRKKILLAINEDGLGPLTFGFYIVRGILKDNGNVDLRVRRSKGITNFDTCLTIYSDREKWQGTLHPPDDTDNLIRVEKDQKGAVNVEGTIARLWTYPRERLFYPRFQGQEEYDVVIDFGVPTVAHAAAKAGIPSITVFDHSWGLTLLKIAIESNKKSVKPGQAGAVQSCRSSITKHMGNLEPTCRTTCAISAIKADESCTDRVYLFPPYLTPCEFDKHWRDLGVPVELIRGVFGGPPSGNWKGEVSLKRKFGIGKGEKAVLISGGGTGVWDKLVPEILDQFLIEEREGRLDYHVLAFATDNYIKQNKAKPPHKKSRVDFVIPEMPKGKGIHSQKVKLLRFGQKKLNYQDIIDGVTLIVSRAGGATVNDAIARRVPLALVPEEGHWQVEAIREQVQAEGLAGPEIPFELFTEYPVKATKEIGRRVRNTSMNRKIRAEMALRDTGQEISLAREIMKLCP